MPEGPIELTELVGKTIEEASLIVGDFVFTGMEKNGISLYSLPGYELLSFATDPKNVIISVAYAFVEGGSNKFTFLGMQTTGAITETEFLEVLKNNKFTNTVVDGIDNLRINSKLEMVTWTKSENSDFVNFVAYANYKNSSALINGWV